MARRTALLLVLDHGRNVAEFVNVYGDYSTYRVDDVLTFVGF
jgi:hypothetical protein